MPELRARLSALGFDAPLTADSVGLVSSLLDALIIERDKSRGLATTADAQAQALFHEAKELYRASHTVSPDEACQQGFGRVQAKAHPDIEYVEAGPGGGGYARVIRGSVELERLP